MLLTALCLLPCLAGETNPTTWPDNRAAAISLTYDDSRRDHYEIAEPEMTVRGLRGTFFVNPGFPNWNAIAPRFLTAAQHGHELADHTMQHPFCRIQTAEEDVADPPANTNFHSLEEFDADCVQVKTILDGMQAPRATVSFAYPGGQNEAGTRDIVAQHFLSARLSTSNINVNAADPPYPMMLMACYVGSGYDAAWGNQDYAAAKFAAILDAARLQRGWVIEEYHDIRFPGYSAVNLDAYNAHLDDLAAGRDDGSLWVAPQGDVTRYIKERNAVQATTSFQTRDAFELVIDDNLPDDVFDVPVTLVTTLPNSWPTDGLKVQYEGAPLPFAMLPARRGVMYSVLPKGHSVRLSVTLHREINTVHRQQSGARRTSPELGTEGSAPVVNHNGP